MMYVVTATVNKTHTSWGPFHNIWTAIKWLKIVELEKPKFRNKTYVTPLNYVNSDPFSSATMKVTKVKNNRKRVNDYEYIKVK